LFLCFSFLLPLRQRRWYLITAREKKQEKQKRRCIAALQNGITEAALQLHNVV
jgi:hypothetical protein